MILQVGLSFKDVGMEYCKSLCILMSSYAQCTRTLSNTISLWIFMKHIQICVYIIYIYIPTCSHSIQTHVHNPRCREGPVRFSNSAIGSWSTIAVHGSCTVAPIKLNCQSVTNAGLNQNDLQIWLNMCCEYIFIYIYIYIQIFVMYDNDTYTSTYRHAYIHTHIYMHACVRTFDCNTSLFASKQHSFKVMIEAFEDLSSDWWSGVDL